MNFEPQYYLLIAVVPLIDVIQNYCSYLIKKSMQKDYFETRYQLKGFQIIPSVILFQWLLTKQKLYFHHWVSLIIIGIALIIIAVTAFIISVDPMDLFLIELQYMGLFTIIAIQDIIIKWLIDAKELSVHKFLFYQGVFGIIMTTIIILVLPNEYQDSSSMEGFSKSFFRVFSYYYLVLLFFAYILMKCGNYIFVLLAIKYYTPIHKAVCETFYTFIMVVFSIISDEERKFIDYITYMIGFVFIFVFGLIYNEIIVIHICKLDYYTNLEIEKRSETENKFLLQEIEQNINIQLY